MSIVRRRLSPDESRAAALDAARTLLVEHGPQALTLKAVAARIGRTHANVLHHFGSAAGLQQALAARMADDIVARIADAVAGPDGVSADPRPAVDLAFDAFGREGGAALAGWAVLNGEREVLTPVLSAIHRLVDRLGPADGKPVAALTLMVVLTAIGDGLLGAAMAGELGLPRDTARELTTRQLLAFAGVANEPEFG